MSTTTPNRIFAKTLVRWSALALTAALIGCAGDPTIQSGDDAEFVMGSLIKVDI